MLRSFRSDFRQSVSFKNDEDALIDGVSGRSWSWVQLDGLTDKIASFLLEHKARAGERVVTVLPNSVDTLAIFLACLKCGIDYAPLPPQISASEFSDWSNLVKPTLVIVCSSCKGDVLDAIAGSDANVVAINLTNPFDWLIVREGQPLATPVRPSRLYLKTSGTTGKPKAMVFDSDRLWSSGCAFLAHLDCADSKSRYLNNLPLSYLGGLFNLGLIPLAARGAVVVSEPFSGRSFLSFWQQVERFGINILWLVPSIVRGLLAIARRTGRHKLDENFRHIRFAFLGTAPIRLEEKLEFEETFGIPLLENFALSETTFFSTETFGSRFRRTPNSVGTPLPYITLRFGFRPDMQGVAAEIEVASPYLILGYCEQGGDVNLPVTGDGFFRTGDLGHLDASGNLVIDGRMRDIVKKGGHFVSLKEIEVLAEQHPAVGEAIAVPVAHDFYGEDFVLVLRPKDEDKGLVLTEIQKWLHERIVSYKWPQRLMVESNLPRTSSGKVIKSELASILKL